MLRTTGFESMANLRARNVLFYYTTDITHVNTHYITTLLVA